MSEKELCGEVECGLACSLQPAGMDHDIHVDDPAGSLAADMAEAVRFELTDGRPSPVFKTGALNRSATLP